MLIVQFIQQKDMFVATIQKYLLTQQQIQLSNVFQSQKDGVLIYSQNDTSEDDFSTAIQVELFNTAFTDLANVRCDDYEKKTLG
jgi:hypothetical protein